MPTDFKPGDVVTVTDGTFEDYTGTVTSIGEGGITIQIVIFGRPVTLSFSPDSHRPKRPGDKDPTPPIG